MNEYREFFVGDQVMVVDEPYLDCPFIWVEDMTRMCGKLVTIVDKSYSDSKRTYVYRIKEATFMWCGNCFVPLEPEEELPDIEDDSFLSVIHTGGVKLYDRDKAGKVQSRRSGRSHSRSSRR